MNNETHDCSSKPVWRGDKLWHPEEVVQDTHLPLDEKRALLASWASDERAVLGAPNLRQLHSGALVSLASILAALAELDGVAGSGQINRKASNAHDQRYHDILSQWRRRSPWRRRSRDDDDDPSSTAPAALPLPAWA